MEYLIVTDYLVPSKSDVSDELQKIIDDNPNRTIFFRTAIIISQSL